MENKEPIENKKDEPTINEKSGSLEKLPKELEPILQNIPKQQRQKIIKAFNSISIQHTFSGPLPHPDILKGYNDVVKDGAERILAMAEKQSHHRISLEDFAVREGFRQSKHGQIYGFIIGLVVLLLATYLGLNGHDWLAGVFGTSTIGAFLAAFVLGKKQAVKNK